jgi:hypothetical protein
MTQKEMYEIARIIEESLQGYVEDLVKREAQLLPFLIRRELHDILYSELGAEVRKAIRDRITVDVKVRNSE